MKYRFWIFQEEAPPWALAGNPQAPKPGEPVPGELKYPGRETEGVEETVDQIVGVFIDHGVTSGSEIRIIQSKVTEALTQGSYRTALPTPGRWLLAEPAHSKNIQISGEATA